jgi:hypothetical protein
MTKAVLRPILDQSFEHIKAAAEPGTMPENLTADRPSASERMAAGKAPRREVARKAQGVFHKNPKRPHPIEILELQNRRRAQKLVPVRYARLLASPFAWCSPSTISAKCSPDRGNGTSNGW